MPESPSGNPFVEKAITTFRQLLDNLCIIYIIYHKYPI
jgi:hypothetical protein